MASKPKNKYGAVVNKSSGMGKIKSAFKQNIPDNLGEYILHNKVLPALKDFIFDAITNTASMLIFKKPVNKKSGFTAMTYKDAFNWSDNSSNSTSSLWGTASAVTSGKRWDFTNIVFPSVQHANAFIEHLCDIINDVGYVSIFTMYGELEQTTAFTNDNYGWYTLAKAMPVRTSRGWIIDFPPVQPIRR